MNINLEKLREEAVPISSVLTGQNSFPRGSLYVVFRDEELVYIGSTTKSLRARLKGHINSPSSLLGEFLVSNPDDFTVSVLQDENFRKLEEELVRDLRPEFNRGGLPPGRWTGEAKKRHEAQLEADRKGQERFQLYRSFFNKAVAKFTFHVHGPKGKARHHIMRAAERFAEGEEVSVGEVVREAVGIFFQEVERLERDSK